MSPKRSPPGAIVCYEERSRAGRPPYRDQDEEPAAMGVEHLRACRQRAAGRRGRGARADAREAGAPYSYFDPSQPARLWPPFGSADTLPVDWTNPPKLDPAPMQVVRRYPIHAETMAINRAYWALPGVKGTVWEHYMLVAAQWPTSAAPPGPDNDGAFFPGRTDAPARGRTTTDRSTAAAGESGQHDDGDLPAGSAVELHGLPPDRLQRARARFRRHPRE